MKNIFSILLLLFSFSGLSQLIHDESHLDESFWQFKTKLEYAVMKKDTGLLHGLLADVVYGGPDDCSSLGCTKDEFILYHFGNDTESSESEWAEMSSVLRYGFEKILADSSYRFRINDSIAFRAPSYLSKIDNNAQLIVLGQNVNIREQPGIKSKIIRTSTFEKFECSCSIITETEETSKEVDGIKWVQIRIGVKVIGYIASKYTTYDINRDIVVGKEKGKWKLIYFGYTRYC